MDEIKENDVVHLNSGGPEMTVGRIEVINGIPNAVCSWFLKSGERKIGTFPVGTLEKKK
jgi:uncharacterized protein YodC (DUF2158 family)